MPTEYKQTILGLPESILAEMKESNRLDNLFNCVNAARMQHRDVSLHIDLKKLKKDFIEGLDEIIGKSLPQYAGISISNLKEMRQLAEFDWSDVGTIKGLYSYYFEKVKPWNQYDEQFIFAEK